MGGYAPRPAGRREISFFTAHCTSCHATGANYSPMFDLTSYALVTERLEPSQH